MSSVSTAPRRFPWDVDCPACDATTGQLCGHLRPGRTHEAFWVHRASCEARRLVARTVHLEPRP